MIKIYNTNSIAYTYEIGDLVKAHNQNEYGGIGRHNGDLGIVMGVNPLSVMWVGSTKPSDVFDDHYIAVVDDETINGVRERRVGTQFWRMYGDTSRLGGTQVGYDEMSAILKANGQKWGV